MSFNFTDAPMLLFLLPLVWWTIGIYFALRFLRAFERGVDAHVDIARELARRPPSSDEARRVGGRG